jgi:type IV pilus assembly protein PilC
MNYSVDVSTPMLLDRPADPPPRSRVRTAKAVKVSRAELALFTQQLALMCQSGLDLAEALRGLAGQSTSPAFREVLEQVYHDVSHGTRVSDALRRHPTVFDATYLAIIAAGEQSGAVPEVLKQLVDLLRNDLRLRAGVRSALTYPMVLLAVAGFVLLALVFFVLPQFAKVFEDLEHAAPPLTQMLLDAGAALRSHWMLIAAGAVVTGMAIVQAAKSSAVGRYLDGVVMRVALLRSAFGALLTGRSLRLLGTVLAAGVPLLDGIRLCRQSTRNRLFQGLFARLERDVVDGRGMSNAFVEAEFLPFGVGQMVVTAERTGRIAPVMLALGEYYQEEGEQRLRELAKLLEPAIIIVMGVLVTFVVLSVVLPLLDVSTLSSS